MLLALGKSDFGLYGVVGGLTVFISFLNILLSEATSRFYAYAQGFAQKQTLEGNAEGALEECRKWFSTSVLIHTIVPSVLMVIGYPIGLHAVEDWLTIPVDRMDACRWVFRFVCISCFSGMVNVPFRAMYTAKQYIAELTIYGVVATTVNVVFSYYMVTHPGEWLSRYAFWMCCIIVVPQVCISIRSIMVFPECRFRWSYALSWNRVSRLTTYAICQAFGGLGLILRGQGIQLLVNKYFCPAYNAAMSIGNRVSSQSNSLSSAMEGAFTPAIATACGAGRREEMIKLSYWACKFGMLFGLLFMLPLSLELDAILKIWLVDPPPCTAALCLCILMVALIEKSVVGHMLAILANGKIAAFQMFNGCIQILSLPLAWVLVANGCGFVSVGWAMVAMMIICAIGRVLIARSMVGMSARYWLFKILAPMAVVTGIAGGAGWLVVRYSGLVGFPRICITTIVCESFFVPLAWLLALEKAEKAYLYTRVRKIFKR